MHLLQLLPIRCHEYLAGLWKPDLIRGLMWHTKGAKLIPRQSADRMRAVNNAFPSWSWASVGYELVKNSQKNNNNFQALSRIEDVQIDLVDQRLPFGAVKSGSVTITGPLKKAPRLYNKEWKSVETSMLAFERHVSEIVEKESLGGVEHMYSSPPGGHFAALQMLGDMQSLDLLMLEATGKGLNGINVYRRVGVLTLWYFPKRSMASPDLCCAQQTGMHIRCGSTAYCYLPRKRPDTYRHKKTLGRAPVSPDIAGPCPAEPFQLVPTQLGLISAGIDQLRACESPPKRGLLATGWSGGP